MRTALQQRAANLVFPVANEIRFLDRLLLRVPPPQHGRLIVDSIHYLEKAEKNLRATYPFDPTGL